MEATVATSLAWIMALCSGLMAGTYFAFSGFLMRSLASLGTAQAVAAMNTINSIILKSAFMPLFFGSTVIDLAVMPNLIRYIENGEVKPALAATYPLSELHAAQTAFIEKAHTGNIVVVP